MSHPDLFAIQMLSIKLLNVFPWFGFDGILLKMKQDGGIVCELFSDTIILICDKSIIYVSVKSDII